MKLDRLIQNFKQTHIWMSFKDIESYRNFLILLECEGLKWCSGCSPLEGLEYWSEDLAICHDTKLGGLAQTTKDTYEVRERIVLKYSVDKYRYSYGSEGITSTFDYTVTLDC